MIFNSYVALCENHFLFEGKYLKKGSNAQQVMNLVELGNAICLLREYTGNLLNTNAQASLKKSAFRSWTNRWFEGQRKRKQNDAIRLLGSLVEKMKREHEATLDGIEGFERVMCAKEQISVVDLLGFWVVIRNKFGKDSIEEFWQLFHSDIFDLMRRFVTATTRDTYRFGKVSSDGKSIKLWARGQREEKTLARETRPHWRGHICIAAGVESPGVLFSINDLIRINPNNQSVWAYFSGKTWCNLTYVTGQKELHEITYNAEKTPWLPSPAEHKNCELRRVYGA